MARNRRSRSLASERIRGPGADDSARQVAYRYLARFPRSTEEVRAHLVRRGFVPEVVSGALQSLRDHGYIDDVALAGRRAEDLLLRRGYGRLRVVHELTLRGVADSVIDAAIAVTLQDRTERQLACEALDRKLRGHPVLGAAEHARAFRFLVARGHPAEIVREILGDDN
jgi:regulatory protein